MSSPQVEQAPEQNLQSARFVPLYLVLVGSVIATCVVYSSVLAGCLTGVLAWTALYWFLAIFFNQVIHNGRDLIEGAPRGTYYVSITHQFPVCGGILIALLAWRFGDIRAGNAWWVGAWGGWDYQLERHVHLSIIGYELKDFFTGGVTPGFVLHHLFTIAGCTLCLFTPLGAGIVTINALVAELGSAFYNLFTLACPDSVLGLSMYVVMMSTSNGLAGWITSQYWIIDGLGLGWKVSYLILAVLLIAIRTMGVVLGVKAFRDKSHPHAEVKFDQIDEGGPAHV
eukprot:TRINITY_DN9132_c0_g2_i2.p1 TRINITY_DN9132_c0_g2~~TRINITY_DN9132_c0_g2_i2.p1  ORF type:complete len:301 (-),score=68.69 TRINITY_DN9132_c0_g2_i2:308-1156(-)